MKCRKKHRKINKFYSNILFLDMRIRKTGVCLNKRKEKEKERKTGVRRAASRTRKCRIEAGKQLWSNGIFCVATNQ